jgi:predicted nucleotidyltransferase
MTAPDVIGDLVTALAAHPSVVAITLGGSHATGRHDERSDHDIEVFTDGEVPLDFRRELALRFDPRPEVGNDWFGSADEWVDRVSGTTIDIAFFDRDWFDMAIRGVIERHRPALGYTTALWHTLRHARPVFDRDGWLATMQELAASPYPDELRRNIVAWNHPVLRDARSSYRHQVELALRRDDPVSVNHRVAALLASAFDIVFALHRTLHPGEKRLLDHLDALGEATLAQRVRVLLRAAGDPGGNGALSAVDALCDTLDAAIREAGLWSATRRGNP